RRRWLRVARRSLPVAGIALVVIVVLVIGVHLVRSALRSGSGPGRLPAVQEPRLYSVDYRVTFTNGHIVNDERHVVERPFHSYYVVRRGGKIVTGTLANDQGLYFYTEDKGWGLVDPGTQPASDDPRPAATLRTALRQGQAKVLHAETVAGRRCTLVRTGSPMGEALKAPTGRNHTDLCV